jgi:hypothetical protein
VVVLGVAGVLDDRGPVLERGLLRVRKLDSKTKADVKISVFSVSTCYVSKF